MQQGSYTRGEQGEQRFHRDSADSDKHWLCSLEGSLEERRTDCVPKRDPRS